MKRSLLAAAAMLLMATTANADIVGEARSGAWSVYETNGDGKGNRPLCGMKISGDASRSLHIKYLLGNDYLTIMAFKDSWRFPVSNVSLPITLGFDKEIYSTDKAIGVHDPAIGGYVQMTVPYSIITEFMRNFAEANLFWLRFDEGTEAPWTGKMIGSRKAGTWFSGCVKALIAKYPNVSTQPYGKPQATQPYGKPAPTQPYGKQSAPSQPTVQRAPKRDDGSI